MFNPAVILYSPALVNGYLCHAAAISPPGPLEKRIPTTVPTRASLTLQSTYAHKGNALITHTDHIDSPGGWRAAARVPRHATCTHALLNPTFGCTTHAPMVNQARCNLIWRQGERQHPPLQDCHNSPPLHAPERIPQITERQRRG